MKVKRASTVIMLLIVVILTGCVSGTAHIIVHKNGSADATIKFAIQQQGKKYLGAMNPLSSMQSILQNNGFHVKEYDNKNDFGFQASRHYKSITEFQSGSSVDAAPASGDNTAGANQIISFSNQVDKHLFFTTYHIKSIIDFSSLYDDFLLSFGHQFKASDAATGFVAAALREKMKLNIQVSLPLKAAKSNATTIKNHNKTLEWTISPIKKNTLTLQVNVPNMKNILIAGGMLLLTVCIGLYIWFRKRKTKNKK